MGKYIGIITAIEQELQAIKKIMENIEEIYIYNLTIYKGIINDKECLLTKCGIGKVNSARITQILTDKFDLSYIINTGSAGGLNESLNIGDIVVGNKCVQHDFDTTPFGDEKGYIEGTGKFFEGDKILIEKCKNIKIENINIVEGIVASGDIFLNDTKMKEKIRTKFNADCVEMEGAAISQVCYLNKMPFIVIRSISDKPNGTNEIDFTKFIEYASKNCAKFIQKMV